MAGYRISELAARSGFPASTLRFYEQEGLLPAAVRTRGGYRSYDDGAVRRLGLIARAKELGVPLDEIRELAGIWDAGECAPVQRRLAELATGGIADADTRIGELAAFRAHLVAALDGLGRHTPDGPCDGDCGCVGRGPGSPAPPPVRPPAARPATLPAVPATGGGEAVACTLTGSEQQDRAGAWARLLGAVLRREDVGDGIRLVLPADADLIGQVARLAALEQGCCRFFRFTLDLSGGAAALTVRAPAHATELLQTLFGDDPPGHRPQPATVGRDGRRATD